MKESQIPIEKPPEVKFLVFCHTCNRVIFQATRDNFITRQQATQVREVHADSGGYHYMETVENSKK